MEVPRFLQMGQEQPMNGILEIQIQTQVHTVTNTYAAPGTYTVTLIVTDANPVGCTETITISVFIVGENIVVDQTTYTVEELS